jgi:hypothetical protein
MKLVLFAVTLIGLVSCAGEETIRIERFDGQVQEIKQGLSNNKIGDTIIVKDVYIGSRGTITHYYGNYHGTLPENWSDSDSTGRLTYAASYDTAIVLNALQD